MPDPVPKESYIKVLNLADSNIELAVLHHDLFQLSIEPFQVSLLLVSMLDQGSGPTGSI